MFCLFLRVYNTCNRSKFLSRQIRMAMDKIIKKQKIRNDIQSRFKTMESFFRFVSSFKSGMKRFYHMITDIVTKATVNRMFWLPIGHSKRHMISIKTNTSLVTGTIGESALPMAAFLPWRNGNNIMRLWNWQHSQ